MTRTVPLRRNGILLLAALAWSASAFASKSRPPAEPAATEVAEKQSDLKDLRGQIESLRKEMTAAEGTRADAADSLKDAEREISSTQRDLHQLTGQRSELQAKLRDLGNQSRDLENRLSTQQGQLEKLIYRQYLQGKQDSLRLLLNGDDPNQLARDLHYLAAIGRSRSQLLREIETTLRHKQLLAADTRERAEQLVAIEAQQKEQHGRLVAQREERKATLEKISAKIAAQRREIGNLQRDEKRLTQLLERLAKIIAAKPPSPAHRETSARHEHEAAPKMSVRDITNERSPEAMPASNFAHLKGRLRLPAKGVVSNRFGGPRQEGSTWKGLFIRAGVGVEVKAIAAGRVVFAEWMRGFGNLLIIDHGSSYLSIYGNNDALLKQVGDSVRGGEELASVGNSGGNPESGLYFELRHQGQPLDPLKWVNIK